MKLCGRVDAASLRLRWFLLANARGSGVLVVRHLKRPEGVEEGGGFENVVAVCIPLNRRPYPRVATGTYSGGFRRPPTRGTPRTTSPRLIADPRRRRGGPTNPLLGVFLPPGTGDSLSLSLPLSLSLSLSLPISLSLSLSWEAHINRRLSPHNANHHSRR